MGGAPKRTTCLLWERSMCSTWRANVLEHLPVLSRCVFTLPNASPQRQPRSSQSRCMCRMFPQLENYPSTSSQMQCRTFSGWDVNDLELLNLPQVDHILRHCMRAFLAQACLT